MSKAVLLSIAVVLLASLGCQPPPADPAGADVEAAAGTESGAMDAVKQANLEAINDLVGRFVAAYLEEDADAFVELFTEDAIRMPPEAPAFRGHGRIRDHIQGIFETTDTEITVHVEETDFSGDLAFVRGTWSVNTVFADGSPPLETVGKWVNLIERQPDGSWKIVQNIWNTDRPVPAS